MKISTTNLKFYQLIKGKSFCKNSVIIKNLFNDILGEQDDSINYKNLIYNDMFLCSQKTLKIGKFFKQNKGIFHNIKHIYYYKYEAGLEKNDDDYYCCIFSVQIYDKIYYCYLDIQKNDGCSTCYLDKYQDNKLYINNTLENLITYSIPNNKIYQYCTTL